MNLTQKSCVCLLAIVGVINTLPVLGVFDIARLTNAYGINITSLELEILLRHRALLFGIIGGAVFASIAYPALRLPAMLMTGISMLGFLAIFGLTANAEVELTRIAVIDGLGLIALAGAALLNTVSTQQTPR